MYKCLIRPICRKIRFLSVYLYISTFYVLLSNMMFWHNKQKTMITLKININLTLNTAVSEISIFTIRSETGNENVQGAPKKVIP